VVSTISIYKFISTVETSSKEVIYMKVGFIGLGIMGSRMAANLLRHGHDLVIFNRTESKAQPLIKLGANPASSAVDLAQQVDVLFTMLAKPEVVREIATGQQGFLSHLRPAAIWADCSTVNPSFSLEMAALATNYKVHFLDAPVLGSKVPAEKGQLSFYIGGRAQDFEICRPFFEAMGNKIVHVGKQGMGSSMKLCLNLMSGLAMLAFSEATHLGESMGIPQQVLFDTILGSIVAAPNLALKRGNIENNQYDTEFSLKWLRKDLQLATQTGYEQNIPMPVTNAAKEIYAMAEQAGLGEQDFSVIFKFLRAE
jgi:3-hydroxyisobutyrate dehydrogenase-like beta-hydroxyacid dehydrogenase